MKTWKHMVDGNALPRTFYAWELDRATSALPNSYRLGANGSGSESNCRGCGTRVRKSGLRCKGAKR